MAMTPSTATVSRCLNNHAGDEMDRITAADEKTHMGHFYQAARHTMQLDFNTYVRDLMQELEKGRKRARVSA